MRASLFRLFIVCALASFSGVAQAQIHVGDVRLALDTSLFAWGKEIRKGELAGTDLEQTITTNALGGRGPVPGLGLGLGYVLREHAILGLYSSFTRKHVESESRRNDNRTGESETQEAEFELRPNLEVPFLTDHAFVPAVVFGPSFLHRRAENGGGNETKDNGLGFALGLAAHAFAGRRASFDLSLVYRLLFMFGDTLDALEDSGVDDAKIREHLIALNIGVSFWL